MVFWHLERRVGNRCLFGVALQHLLTFHRRDKHISRYQIQRVQSQIIFKASTELACGLSGALNFQSWEKPHPCLEKIFLFFFPLLMSLLLLWRGSECCIAWLEKPTVTHFCPASSPPCDSFISIGLLNSVGVHGLFLCPTYLGIHKFCGGVNNSFPIIVRRKKYISNPCEPKKKKCMFSKPLGIICIAGSFYLEMSISLLQHLFLTGSQSVAQQIPFRSEPLEEIRADLLFYHPRPHSSLLLPPTCHVRFQGHDYDVLVSWFTWPQGKRQ